MPTVVWIAIGGAMGAVSRWLLAGLVTRVTGTAWPWGTLTVNVLGCFALGAFLELAASRGWVDSRRHAICVVGFLGAFTTFSTFAAEADTLLRRESVIQAGAYAAVSVLLGFAAFVVARSLVRSI